MYKQYFDILSENEYLKCKEIIDNSLWKYGQVSSPNSPHKFWMLENLHANSFFHNIFMEKIENLTNNKFEISRIYANGNTFAQEGDWHVDSYLDDAWTFLYYFNKGDVSTIGETYFKHNNVMDVAKPIFNSGVFFKSDIEHKGCSPKINFTDLRITIAFKLKTIKLKSYKTIL